MADQGTEGLLSPWLRGKRVGAARPYLYARVLDFGCGSGALAELVSSDHYLGVDTDEDSLRQARLKFPQHRFLAGLPEPDEKFDCVVALAVIEHVGDPSGLLLSLSQHLDGSGKARLVVTTPHPSVDWIHGLGASVGLFSKHANEEHEALLDRTRLESAGMESGLNLVAYRRFLLGANQLAVYARADS